MEKICRDCGKRIDESKTWFWRYWGGYEFYCSECGRGRLPFGDEPNAFGLHTNCAWDPANDKEK